MNWVNPEKELYFIFFNIYIYVPLIDVFSWARSARDALESAKSVLGEWSSTRNAVVGFCWRPPDEEEEADEAHFRHLEKSLEPQAGYEHHKGFLEWFEGGFLIQEVRS